MRKPGRKSAQQSRSRATVTAILDATIRILEREPAEAATTTRIAEVAGVSVGTLYQYFSNRDEILDALQEREFERAAEFLRCVLDHGVTSERELARAVVDGLLALYDAAPALHRVLVVEGLRVTPADRVHAFDVKMLQALQVFLSNSQLNLRRKNLPAAAFVIYQSVRATMLAKLFEAPPGLDDATLADELTDLIVRYLVRDAVEAEQRAAHEGEPGEAQPKSEESGRAARQVGEIETSPHTRELAH